MDREQALQALHDTLPPNVGFSVRCATTTHSREDFFKSPPTRTGEYRSEEQWTVTLQCRRGAEMYLEATREPTLADAVNSAIEQFRAWERQEAEKPPKLVAPIRMNQTSQQAGRTDVSSANGHRS
jgi:hypothetical protein